MVQTIFVALELFARAGGGGSGGGGSSGGGGDGIVFLALVGYVPTHGLGAFLRRKLPSESGAASLLDVATVYYMGDCVFRDVWQRLLWLDCCIRGNYWCASWLI